MSRQTILGPVASGEVEPVEELGAQNDAARPRRELVHWLWRKWSSAVDWVVRCVRRHTVTVAVEGEQVRVVVFRGRRVIHWVTIPSKAAQEDGPAQQEERAARLIGVIRGLGLRRVRVVSDLPLLLPMVSVLHLPQVGRRYLDRVVTTEALEAVSFSGEEVDVVWQGQKEEDGITVAATVLPRSGVDARVAWLRGQGLCPAAAYAQATALALAAVESDVLLLHLGPSQGVTALVQGWVPQVLHQVPLAAGERHPRDLAMAVARALEQVASFGSTDVEDEDSPTLPVVVTGDVGQWEALLEEIARVVERPILSGRPPVTYSPGFPLGEYGINVGLALAERLKERSGRVVSQRRPYALNLLPERHQPRPLPVRSAAPLTVLLLLGATAFNVAPIVQRAEAEVSFLSPRVERLEREGRQQRLQLAKARRLTQYLATSKQQGQAVYDFMSEQKQALTLLERRVALLAEDALPATARLRQLTLERGEFTVTGVAASYADVFQYVAELKDSGLFSDVRLPRVVATRGVLPDGGQTDSIVEFQVVAGAALPQESTGASGQEDDGGQRPGAQQPS